MQSVKSMYDLAEVLGGLVITSVLPGSPSQRAGVRYGDILLRYDGRPTPSLTAYVDAKQQCHDEVPRVTVFRAGRELELSLEGIDRHERTPSELVSALGDLADARLFGGD